MGSSYTEDPEEDGQSVNMALIKISTSTWGATFSKARQVYIAVVRPAITYGSPVWHTPKDVKKSSSTDKISCPAETNASGQIAGAFKSNAYLVSKRRRLLPLSNIHLDHLQAKKRDSDLRGGGQSKIS